MPSSYHNYLNSNFIDQSLAYVLGVLQDIEKGMKEFGENKFFPIPYDSFCKHPQFFMELFSKWYLREDGFGLEIRRKIPSHFQISNNIKVTHEETDMLKNNIDVISNEISRDS